MAFELNEPDLSIESVGRAYDQIEEQWHASRSALTPTFERLLDRALAACPSGPSVLDVGCGSGVPVDLWLVAHGARVTGLDGSKQLLELARDAVPLARFVLGDMRTAELGGPFDIVVAWDSVFHVARADHPEVFARFASWLKPRGVLVLSLGGSSWEGTSEMFGEQFFYSGHAPAESIGLIAAAGFVVDHSEIDDPSSRGHVAVLAHRAEQPGR